MRIGEPGRTTLRTPWRRLAALVFLGLSAPAWGQAATPEADALWRGFQAPPAEARPMVRWWWFGPAVTPAGIDREIRAMKAGGFGGFEVQPVYPLSPDAGELRNLPFLSDAFITALRHAATTARAEGMRIDVTGGSGWPFGGPHIPVTEAASNVRMQRVAVPAGAREFVLPDLGPGERRLSVLLRRGAGPATADEPFDALTGEGPRLTVPPADTAREALVFIAGRTGQQVKRPSIGGEGFVLDHIDDAAVSNHLTTVGDRLLQAFVGQAPPDAVFSDSLEAYGSSWTADLPAEFRRRRGYDLLAHLPALFLDGERSAAVRYDWARTLSELVDERYLAPIDQWARARGTRFRAQVYGTPPPTLSSNALVALPEGEGADWRRFTSTRWATSAAHLYGKPVVSSETWTWLHSPSWAATPLDMKVEADRHFLQGVTQLIGHGWPYSPPEAGEPGWAFYAAAALNDRNPWYAVMPEVTRYLHRLSWMLRQGEPANAVAIYLPIEDAFAAMRTVAASANDAMGERVPEALVEQVLGAGHGFDFIDAKAIGTSGFKHRVLVLPSVERIDAEAYAAIARWVAQGGRLVAVGALPRTAGGLLETDAPGRVQAITRELSRSPRVQIVPLERAGGALLAAASPDVRLTAADPALGFLRRKLPAGDLYLVVNTGSATVRTRARFAGDRGNGEWWDPMSGRRWSAGRGDIALDLGPYESRLLVFAGASRRGKASSAGGGAVSRPLGAGWTLTLPNGAERQLADLRSWTEIEGLRHHSGTLVYRSELDMGPLPAGRCLALDFGQAVPRQERTRAARPVAALDAPVRDAAVVKLNGATVGGVWAPPYRIDLSAHLRPGRNRLEVHVSNTAVNALAGRAPTDYRLLNARYGERFTPQDIGRIAPAPSGLLGPVTLVEAPSSDRPCGQG